MRRSAFVLGLIGGVIGLLAGILVLVIGGGVSAFGGDGSFPVLLGFVTFALAVAGIVGASIADARPVLAGFLMMLAGVVGFLTAGLLWLLSGPLLVLAGIFAWVASDREASLREDSHGELG
jgi:hypothetical protein